MVRAQQRAASGCGMLALAAVAVLLAVQLHGTWAQLTSINAALLAPTDDSDYTPKVCQGKTPAHLVIDRVAAFPADGKPATIVIRNMGGQTANLTGYRLTNSDTRAVDAALNLVFGQGPCNTLGNVTIEPSRVLKLTPKNDTNPCGFPFAISYRDEVNLFDANGTLVSAVKWGQADQGFALRQVSPDPSTPSYRDLPENRDVVGTLQALGGYSTFVEALKAVGFADKLTAGSDPAYAGAPPAPVKATKDVAPQFPWWFGFGVDRSKLPPPPPPPAPPPPPPVGVPALGPYTLLAPNDEAFTALLRNLGGGRTLPKEQLFALPELKDILLYHIFPGRYTTADMYNNTGIYTTKSVEVTPFNDPCMTEGKMMLHDACVDKPTPDNFTCEDQVVFNKCYFPFMTSALAAQWQGGFCQRTCMRCSCAPDSGIQCAQIVLPDVVASNGVIQGISRVLFPPPSFNKSMYATQPLDPAVAAALNSSAPLPVTLTPPAGAAAAPTGIAAITRQDGP